MGAGTALWASQPAVHNPVERGSFHEYWPFPRYSVLARQPEARRIRSRNSFGSTHSIRTNIRLVNQRPQLAEGSISAGSGFLVRRAEKAWSALYAEEGFCCVEAHF